MPTILTLWYTLCDDPRSSIRQAVADAITMGVCERAFAKHATR